MRLALLAALGTAAVATAAGAGLGWHYAPGSSDNRTHLVLATVPTGPPVYVQPECAATEPPSFKPPAGTPAGSGTPQNPIAGRVPPGFTPVRAVRCQEDYQTGGFAVTQSETTTPSDLQTLLAALRPPLISEPVGPHLVCPDIGIVPLAIALVDAHGTAVRVDLPRDRCDLYAEPSLQKLGTVHWTVTATTQAPAP